MSWGLALAGATALLSACGDDAAGGAGPSGQGGAGAAHGGGAGGAVQVVPASEIRQCLLDGGLLEGAGSIDNNVGFQHGGLVALSLASTGQIAVASTDGAVKWWTLLGDAAGGVGGPSSKYDAAAGSGTEIVRAMVYPPDGSWLAAGDDAGRITIWDTQTFTSSLEYFVGELPVAALAVDDQGSRLAAATESGLVWLGDAASPLSSVVESVLDEVRALAFLPGDGGLLLAGQSDGVPTIELHGLGGGGLLRTYAATSAAAMGGPVDAVAVTSDGARIVAAGDAFTLVFDAKGDGLPLVETVGTAHQALSVAIAPGDDVFATAGAEGTLTLWDILDGGKLASLPVPGLVGVAAAAETAWLVTATADGLIHLQGCVAP